MSLSIFQSGMNKLGLLGLNAAGFSGFNPEAALDLIFDEDRYRASDIRYSNFPSVPGSTSSGGVNGTVTRNGVIVSASAPRIGDDGLVVEESRTNLLTYSEDFSNAAWTKVSGTTITSNAAVAPDGTMTADRVNNLDAALGNRVLQNIIISGTTVAGSLWLKGEGSDIGKSVDLEIKGVGGVLVSSVQSVTLTDAWQRVEAVSTQDPLNTGAGLNINSPTLNSATNVLVWGAQLEEASTASSYIPTAGSTVTRTADSVTLTDLDAIGLTSAVLAAGYTVVVEFEGSSASGNGGAWLLWNGSSLSTEGGSLLRYSSDTSSYVVEQRDGGGVSQGNIILSGASTSSVERVAYRAEENNSAASLNGATPVDDETVSLSALVSEMALGISSGGNQLNGHIRRLTIIPRAVSDTELQSLSGG